MSNHVYTMAVSLKWDFAVGEHSGTEGDHPPANGAASVEVAPGASAHQVLADTLDNARAEINRVTTYWKEAVGPEQDSAMGRSNQASNDRGAQEREDDDDEEEEEQEDDES